MEKARPSYPEMRMREVAFLGRTREMEVKSLLSVYRARLELSPAITIRQAFLFWGGKGDLRFNTNGEKDMRQDKRIRRLGALGRSKIQLIRTAGCTTSRRYWPNYLRYQNLGEPLIKPAPLSMDLRRYISGTGISLSTRFLLAGNRTAQAVLCTLCSLLRVCAK